ncbi:MAG: VWA domain-containing protein [Alphaproteobacteria bacterium]|nr:VWA domain-containing protein [Alphaproteobacteria bacterium]MBU6472854.1 VWA domain-containing protein [Alphaproteobacteria bacterium]MDE2012983.1 VWA domain-containing protein [Alphaproteobacteria bacterium]MDE2073746.1 VWA domain-containing protein [Alphaproteobacteria bacterium]MDE2352731.1 VWA domain-containing protein [Alphaproteobacteria bacterium]
MSKGSGLPAGRSSSSEIEAFLNAAARVPSFTQVKGRLVFAIDATMSRGLTWDRASEIQSGMFDVAGSIGGLAVQLVWFRGRGEFEASEWTVTPAALGERMRRVSCRAGFTQLRRVLEHTAEEARTTRIGALVYVGDCFEERHEAVAKAAAALCLRGVPAFMFHEGEEPRAAYTFREVARLTKGVYASFNEGAAERLRDLLKAAAVYAAGGEVALREYGERMGGDVLRLAHAMRGGG